MGRFRPRRLVLGEADAPFLIENDANLMTLAEARAYWPDTAQLLFVKVGTGIGSGIVADGRLCRGAQGAAGDIGHMQLLAPDPARCRCGKLGCVEAYAAGWAIMRALQVRGIDARTTRDVISLVQRNDAEATRLIRHAGQVIGEAIASVVNVLNPSVIVVGGTLAQADELLLSGIRERVFQRSLPLAMRHLGIVRSKAGVHAGNIERTIRLHGTGAAPA